MRTTPSPRPRVRAARYPKSLDGGESEPVQEPAYNTNYKGKTTYADIAEQLRADTTLDLNGLDSEIFTITGYAKAMTSMRPGLAP